ncbi:MAG: hypothetical protein K0S34_442, partial [Bacillales bacterium]|nr:hypothetical protein [Bacillales bacterium]
MISNTVKRYFQKEFNGWVIVSILGAVVILLPILFILS